MRWSIQPALALSELKIAGRLGNAAAKLIKFRRGIIVAEEVVAETGTKALVQVNRTAGNAFRDELANLLRKEGRDVSIEVYKKTPFGKRFIDIEVSMGEKVLGGIETKVGGSQYNTLQRLKDL